MGAVKALLPIEGQPAVRHLARHLLSLCEVCVVVTGHHGQAVREAVDGMEGVRVVSNHCPELGQLSSLQTGLRSLPQSESGWFLFAPVDSFGIGPQVLQPLGEGLLNASAETLLVIPQWQQQRRGHPVAARRSLALEFLALPATATARTVIHAHRDATTFVEVTDPLFLLNVDQPADYAAFLAACQSETRHA